MKNIQPISIWDNGTVQEASVLNAYCINDNLINSAIFYYTLSSESLQQLAQGNLTMQGQDYDDWQTNDYAYNWIATQLNLTIIGDYVPPTTSTTTTLEPTTTTTTSIANE
jgi:hypothetical protein